MAHSNNQGERHETAMSNLNEGQKVSFDIEADRKNGKSAAANLQAV